MGSFLALLKLSGQLLPLLFGNGAFDMLGTLFEEDGNLYSHRHVFVAELDTGVCGMLLGYDQKTLVAEGAPTGGRVKRLLGWRYYLHFLDLMTVHNNLPDIREGEYLVSQVATDERARGRGAGRALIEAAVNEAAELGATRVVLDVAVDNQGAFHFYEKLAFTLDRRSKDFLLKGKMHAYNRMSLSVGGTAEGPARSSQAALQV